MPIGQQQGWDSGAEPKRPPAPDSASPPLDAAALVNRCELQRFYEVLFRYASDNSFVSLRIFDQYDRSKPPWIEGIKVDDTRLIDKIEAAAIRAARARDPAVFAPPVSTFNNSTRARCDNLVNGLAIAIELDEGDTGKKLGELEYLIGPATVVVRSGGNWTDSATGKVFAKLHVYWRLSEPTRDISAHNILALARHNAALLAGADPSGASPVHPFRWPGSVHTKDPAHPVPCRIERINEHAEVHLEDAAQKLNDAVHALGLGSTRGDGQDQTDQHPPAELSDIASALDAIPVEGMAHSEWIIIGMALHNATGGSAAGLALFDKFCRRSPSEYNRRGLEAQWKSFARKPPGKRLRTAGTIFYYARQHGWQFPPRDQPSADEPRHDEAATDEEPRADRQHSGTDMAVLRLQRREAPKLPIEIFGERWSRWIRDNAEASACPMDYVAAPLLSAASAVIGHARWPRAREAWAEPPHLWCASVGDSGDGKSPGADVIYRHVMSEMERRMTVDFPDQLREAQAAIEIAKAKCENWKAEVREAIKAGKTPPQPQPPSPVPEEPIAPRLVLSDATIEKVAILLARAAPKGVLMHRDELAGWLLGMTAYNDGARAFWIEAYGGRPYRVDRVKHPDPIMVPRLAVSWHGGIQPERLAEVMREADDGLLARLTWFWPEPIPFCIADKPQTVDWAVVCFDRLRMLDLAASDNGPRPLMVPLTEAAVGRLELFGKLLQERKETAAGLMRSAIGKARGLTLRLSLILEHLYWCAKDGYPAPPDVITEETLLAAAKFVAEYAMPMAERTYGDAACTELDRNTATLARWIKKERPDAVHVREMQRNVRLPGLTTADTIHDACKALIEAGWLGQPAPGGFQQKPRAVYPVSPRLLEIFSQ